jgi:outer membrane receptor protein involved in Fe transport
VAQVSGNRPHILSAAYFWLLMLPAFAADQGVIRGVVHDPAHRPIAGAQVVASTAEPARSESLATNADGGFQFDNLAEGPWTVAVSAPGFRRLEQSVTVAVGRAPVLHLALELAGISEVVTVSSAADRLSAQTATPRVLVAAEDVARTPGADRTNSLAMITDFTPGASMVHDMLHMRGGHQVNWLIDGVPVINTNIAANVAPLVNPKDVEDLEIQRGGYSSEYGDRTYGFFNVVTPSGFERDNQADLVFSAGNFYSTDDQFAIGGHTLRFAYFASVDANRSELGLAPPVSQVVHDQESGVGGFASLLYNASAKNQLRWVVSLREDHYQVPNDLSLESSGVRDLDLEKAYLGGFHWTHAFSSDWLLTVSPSYHFSGTHYVGGPLDNPFILDDNQRSNYLGGLAALQVRKKRNNLRVGVDFWGQHDDTLFALTANPGGGGFTQEEKHWAHSSTVYVDDQYQTTTYLTLDLGIRLTRYGGLVNENAASPRLGGAIRIPRLNWTLHGYYAYYYQPPPLDSLAGPALAFAQTQGYGFIPLSGERDIQHDIGLTIPLRGWTLDTDNFHTSARNFLDHDAIGDSGIFIPLTDLGAIISGTEVTLRSPRLFHRAQWRVAWSNQIAQGIGPIAGGLLEDAPSGNFLLDHDQRNSVTSVLSLSLPGNLWATPACQFGSGFLNGNGPSHLPPHWTFDLALGKQFREGWTMSANAVNIANTRYLLDTSNTFGGTHFINPRQVYVEVRYRFHF